MTSPEASAAAPRLLVPVLVVGLMVGVFVLLVWPTAGSGGGTHRPAGSVASPPVTAGAGAGGGTAGGTGGGAGGGTRRVEAEAADVLRAWDRQRAAAWAAGDASALSALYVPGASAGEADVAMLADWAARGLAVDGLTTQLLELRVVAHGPRRFVLLVRDRVTRAVAAGDGLAEPLPAGTITERQVVLRRRGATWLVASVRPAPRGPARPR